MRNRSLLHVSNEVWQRRPLDDEQACADYGKVADAILQGIDIDAVLAMPEIKAHPKLVAYIESYRNQPQRRES